MNKLAAIKGLTNASSQKPFRQKHPIFLKKGEAVKRPPPLLPSDVNPKHTYGTPGTYRSAEQIRNAGIEIDGLADILGRLADVVEVCRNGTNLEPDKSFENYRNYIKMGVRN